ncbi:hypothetical protein [Neobacillus ginsengisoli]|uniref:Uncharacterized protein n=1 Tax=Neobacillus ginsengisoli TaxID=904295 RepID=A0ABT9XYF9_9BACI|nr:hypothetical protein [Neobacillus ginsengisoli]MDQ0200605.1 hypothetical protein [Neobacillus ginsengisoli]
MWWKSKQFLISLCFPLILLTLLSMGGVAKAANSNATNGFIIQADRVVGSGMFATIVFQETSAGSAKEPMLRIQYKSATIYGMKLTKQVQSPSGMVSITLKAQGPVTVKGMTVDTTAISFKGACLMASETVPMLTMENVVMVAHYMDNEDSEIKKLVLNTVSGQAAAQMPGKIQLLKDLSLLPVNQLEEVIGRISSGHLPLTCEDGSKASGETGGIGKITDPINNVIGEVTNPLDPITKTLDPVLKPIEPVLKTLNPVLKPIEPVLKPLDPVLKPIEPELKPLDPVIKPIEPVLKPLNPVLKPLDPIISVPSDKVKQSLQSPCVQIKDANGAISKELALSLIDEAVTKKLTLTTVCVSDTSLTNELQKWQDSLLKSLGLLDILGQLQPLDAMQQLSKMRDQIARQKDGSIIFKP